MRQAIAAVVVTLVVVSLTAGSIAVPGPTAAPGPGQSADAVGEVEQATVDGGTAETGAVDTTAGTVDSSPQAAVSGGAPAAITPDAAVRSSDSAGSASSVASSDSVDPSKRPAPLVEQWSETFDSEHGDVIADFERTENGVVFAGQTSMVWGDSPTTQAWIGHVDAFTGDLDWQTAWGDGQTTICPPSGSCFESYPDDSAVDIAPNGDGAYLVSGYTETFTTRSAADGNGKECTLPILLIQVDAGGGTTADGAGDCISWIGGASGAAPAPTGSVVAGMHLASYRTGDEQPQWTAFKGSGIGFTDVISVSDGYVAVGHEPNGPGRVVKLDSSGSVVWSRVVGSGSVVLQSVVETEDGSYAYTGWTERGADLEAIVGETTGASGWTTTYGGSGYQSGHDLVAVSDGFVVAGINAETRPQGTIAPPYGDGWLFKVNESGGVRWERNFTRDDQVGGFATIAKTDNGFVMGGGVKDSQGLDEETLESRDGWVARALRCVDTDGDGKTDDDGDGLCDNWEDEGIDVDGDGQADLDLPAMGADREHKDVFVEIDYMDCGEPGSESCLTPHDHEPMAASLDRIETAFAEAPVDNPDGESGIEIHLQVDEAAPEDQLLDFGSSFDMGEYFAIKYGDDRCGTGAKDGHFGTVADRESDDCEQRLEARLLAYHYLLAAHNNSVNALGLSPTPGNDVMSFATGPKANDVVRERARFTHLKDSLEPRTVHEERVWLESVTMMHELGHNLGLRHGGDDNRNNKPNYLSLMNYQYAHNYAGRATSLPGVDDDDWARVDADLDFSETALPTLDETALGETTGLRGPTDARSLFIRNGSIDELPSRYIIPASGGVDWNRNDRIAGSVEYDVNNDGETTALTGHDDWSALQYNFRETSWFRKQYEKLSDFGVGWTLGDHLDAGLGSPDADDDGVENSADNCPLLANGGQADENGDGTGDACTRETEPPVPAFTVEPGESADGPTLRFDGSDSKDPEERGVIAYTWDFGDESVGYGQSPTHTFPEAGEYTVTLTAEDFDGDTATVEQTVTVEAHESSENGDETNDQDSEAADSSSNDVDSESDTDDPSSVNGVAAVGPLSTLPGGLPGLAVGFGIGLVGALVAFALLASSGILRRRGR